MNQPRPDASGTPAKSNDSLSRGRIWPLLGSLRGATPSDLGRDLIAGLTLAAVAIPVQMATARLGGFQPQTGFIAFSAASIGFALFGANRHLAAGADSTITPIFSGSLALMAAASAAQYPQLAAALALMVGFLLVIAGVLKLGWIADLLSTPVITGFLAGIALHIVLSQAPSVLGLPEGSGNVYHRLAEIAAEAGAINPASAAIGFVVFAITFAAEKISARIPGALIALVCVTMATTALRLDRHGVAVLGQVHGGLPHPGLPQLGFEAALPLVGLAFVIALVVMVQTAATTRSTSGEDEQPDVDRDFIGVGVGSLFAGLLGAFPVNASPPMTSIVSESGGRSQCAGLVAALAVFLLAAFGTPLLAHVPAAALGGVLLFVAQRIFHVRTFREIFRRTRAEFALAVLTTALIVILPIQTGVAIGMCLSLAHGIFTITRAQPIPFERVPETTVWWPAPTIRGGETEPGTLVIGFQAPLSFLNSYHFRRGVLEAITAGGVQVRLLVLEASSIVEIDFTAAVILSDVIAKARGAGIDVAVARLESIRARDAFDRFGVTDLLGQDHLFHSVQEAIQTLADPQARPAPAQSASKALDPNP